MQRINSRLAKELRDARTRGRERFLYPQDNTLVDFTSNDYLGLARQGISVAGSGCGAARSGSGGSRLLSGTTDEMLAVEEKLARFYQTESALVLSSGYQANLALFSGLCRRHDFILYDSLVHASVRDGIRLTHSRSTSFAHNSLESLADKLQRVEKETAGVIFVCVESLYSMDGDFAPLEAMAALCKETGAVLLVDEAHSTGVYGATGAGKVAQLGISDGVMARVHTFGKALGIHGACIVGPAVLKDALVNFSRPFIYSTAPAPAFFEEVGRAHQAVQQAGAARQQLQHLSRHANSIAANLNLHFVATDSAIKSVIISGNDNCRSIAAKVRGAGFDVRAVLAPTVPEGAERIRICLHAFNSEEEVRELLLCVSQCIQGT